VDDHNLDECAWLDVDCVIAAEELVKRQRRLLRYREQSTYSFIEKEEQQMDQAVDQVPF
jgi:hypothetical protein